MTPVPASPTQLARFLPHPACVAPTPTGTGFGTAGSRPHPGVFLIPKRRGRPWAKGAQSLLNTMPVRGTVPLGLGNPGRPRRRGRAPLAVTSSAERRAAPCPGRTRPARPGEDAAAAGRRPPGGPSSATACVDAPRRGAGLSAAGTARAGPCRGPVPLPGTAAPLGQAGAPLRKRAPTLTLGGDRVDGAAPSPPAP